MNKNYFILAALWLVSLGFSFGLGYVVRSIKNRLKTLEKGLAEVMKRNFTDPAPIEKPKPKSSFIDPTDPALIAKLEHDEKLHLLNPDV